MKWQAQAPANIALIKYMGKTEYATNQPANASFSYTLNHLTTRVELELGETSDRWEPLTPKTRLSPAQQARFLNHLNRIKTHFGFNGHFIVRSANNFPAGCGLASSASSFAALTKASVIALAALTQQSIDFAILTTLSRQGSGSSCRSLLDGWVLWDNNGIQPVDLPYPHLSHCVLIVDRKEKSISSSHAHEAVLSSLLFDGRPKRAALRLDQLITALKTSDWRLAYETTWHEFWDMHSLFETASPTFSYLTPQSLTLLRHIQDFWTREGDGPLVTMDAGPNIHLLFRPDQIQLRHQLLGGLPGTIDVFSSGSQ